MAETTKPIYVFGAFRYDAQQRLLFHDGKLIPLVPKAADTLQVLIENSGRIVERSELIRQIWPDTTVEEIGLARNISIVRKALGDDSESNRHIETIPRRGYRFIADIQVLHPDERDGPTKPAWRISKWAIAAGFAALWILIGLVYWQFYRPSRYVPSRSGYANLAVIPFECLSPEIDCGKFSKGFTDITVARLSKLESAQVISPGTVQSYQRARISPAWMGRILGLEALLEGTVQRLDDHVLITARLRDVHSGKLIWAENYAYPAAQMERAETETAEAITREVGDHMRKP